MWLMLHFDLDYTKYTKIIPCLTIIDTAPCLWLYIALSLYLSMRGITISVANSMGSPSYNIQTVFQSIEIVSQMSPLFNFSWHLCNNVFTETCVDVQPWS